MRDEVATTRAAAVELIGELGEVAAPHAGMIAAMLRATDADVREAAVDALDRLGPEYAGDQASAVALCLKHSDFRVRRAAVRALGNMGEKAVPHINQMVQMLGDHEFFVREATSQALRTLEEVDIPRVIKALMEETKKAPVGGEWGLFAAADSNAVRERKSGSSDSSW